MVGKRALTWPAPTCHSAAGVHVPGSPHPWECSQPCSSVLGANGQCQLATPGAHMGTQLCFVSSCSAPVMLPCSPAQHLQPPQCPRPRQPISLLLCCFPSSSFFQPPPLSPFGPAGEVGPRGRLPRPCWIWVGLWVSPAECVWQELGCSGGDLALSSRALGHPSCQRLSLYPSPLALLALTPCQPKTFLTPTPQPKH